MGRECTRDAPTEDNPPHIKDRFLPVYAIFKDLLQLLIGIDVIIRPYPRRRNDWML